MSDSPFSLVVFTDGGSRGNPGAAAGGVVLLDKQKNIIEKYGEFFGEKTNNEAEYLAFLSSLRWIEKYIQQHPQAITSIEWNLDSKLVVEQLSKRWKIKEPRMQEFAEEIWVLLSNLALPYSIHHVPRELNRLADRLVNETLDAQ